MKKRFGYVAVLLIVIFSVFAGCGGNSSASKDKADQVVHNYIFAMVEADDDKLMKVYSKAAIAKGKKNDLLKAGRHLHPGSSKKLNGRYLIKRYESDSNGNELFYYVKYHLPKVGNVTDYLPLKKNDKGEWKITEVGGMDKDEMEKVVPNFEFDKSGEVIHPYHHKNQ